MRKKAAPRPAVWVALFKGVWFVHPVTGEIVSRSSRNTVKVFTIAADKEEAVLRMVNGLLWFDDIESQGKLKSIKRLDLDSKKVGSKVADLVTYGARFVVPYERLRTSDVALLCHVMVAND